MNNQRIKFTIDSSLRIEHSVPFAKDFQLTLSGGGELIRHRVAFFAEDQGLDLISLFRDKEVQVIRIRGGSTRKKLSTVRFFLFCLGTSINYVGRRGGGGLPFAYATT